MPDIFLSYSRDDQAIARRYAEAFEREGFSVWWDVALKSGQAYDRVTENALREAKAVVVLWSKRSVNSDWVRAEATIGLQNKTLTPVMIEQCVRPVMFELTQTPDLSQWKGNDNDPVWQNFVAELRHHLTHGSDTAMYKPPSAARANKPASRNNAMLFGSIALAVVVVAGAVFWFMRGAPSASTPTPAAATANNAEFVPNTIAVLPLENLSPDTKDAYIASGLHDEILNQLTKLSKLKVISRQSVLRFADTKLSPSAIGKELRTANIMTGTVRFADNRIRVTAHLVNTLNEEDLWTETFDIKFADIFDAESQIAMNVANAMRVSFSDAERSNLTKAPTKSPEAYALFLQAVSDSNGIQFGDPKAIEREHQLLDQAIKIDPNFAVAYMQKAGIYAYTQQVQLGREYAKKALALDPTLGSAETLEIQFLLLELKYAEALPLAEAYLKQHPNDLRALSFAYQSYGNTGDRNGALQLALRAFELDKSAGSYNRLGAAYSRLGRQQEAIPYFEKNAEMSPGAATVQLELAYSLGSVGRADEAIRWINEVKNNVLGPSEDRNAGGNLYSALIYANALAGRADEAKRLLALFKQKAEATSDLPTRTRAYVGAGELDQALALMKQMIADKSVANRNSVNAIQMLQLNPHHLKALDRPEFVEVRKQL